MELGRRLKDLFDTGYTPAAPKPRHSTRAEREQARRFQEDLERQQQSGESDDSGSQAEQEQSTNAFNAVRAGKAAVALMRSGWNYPGNGVMTAGINNLQYRQPEIAPVAEDTV